MKVTYNHCATDTITEKRDWLENNENNENNKLNNQWVSCWKVRRFLVERSFSAEWTRLAKFNLGNRSAQYCAELSAEILSGVFRWPNKCTLVTLVKLSYWVEIFDLVNQPAFCVYVAKSGNWLRQFFGRVNNSAELDSKDVSSQVRNTALNFRVS